MKLARFEANGQVFTGKITGNLAYAESRGTAPKEFPVEDVRLLAPCEPTKIVAVGLNYRDHAEELKLQLPSEPLLFMKPSSSVIGPGDTIVLPPQSARVDYEAELAIVIGRTAHRVNYNRATDYILGYACLNDVTARDLQTKDGQWTRSKGFDTFCPIGPWIETELDTSDLKIELFLNGELKQKSTTSNLIFDAKRLVEFISGVMTLYPGDVIATGTPAGIGPMDPEDTVEVRIEGIGSLINRTANAEI